MATLYNKTALKKIKKDELIKMFLDQQAQINDIKMDIDGVNKYKDYFDKWSPILREIQEDTEFETLLGYYGWEYNDEGKIVHIIDYKDDEVDYYVDAGRKAVLKDGRIVKSKD